LPRRPNAGRDIQSAGTGKVFPQNAKKAQEDKSPRLPDQECLPIGQRALAEAVVKSKVPALVARWRDGGWRRVEYAADLGALLTPMHAHSAVQAGAQRCRRCAV